MLLHEIHPALLPKCGEPTTATKAQGAHTVLSRGKTPALLRADLQSPMMGQGPRTELTTLPFSAHSGLLGCASAAISASPRGEPWVLRKGLLSFTLRRPYCSFLPEVKKEFHVVCVYKCVYTHTYIYIQTHIEIYILDVEYILYT